MIVFHNKLVVFVCGTERAEWADKFTRFFQNATCVLQTGRWVNTSTGGIDEEENIAVGAWVTAFDEGSFIDDVVKLTIEYKADQHQEAVMFEVVRQGLMSGVVVFGDDWDEFYNHIDPMYKLLEFFDKEASNIVDVHIRGG